MLALFQFIHFHYECTDERISIGFELQERKTYAISIFSLCFQTKKAEDVQPLYFP